MNRLASQVSISLLLFALHPQAIGMHRHHQPVLTAVKKRGILAISVPPPPGRRPESGAAAVARQDWTALGAHSRDPDALREPGSL